MPHDFLQYTARRPRYQAREASPARLEVRRLAGKQPSLIAAELVDFSRSGFRLRLAAPVEVKENLSIELHVEQSQSPWQFPATVRWQRAEGSQSWLVGCQAQSEVDWETLGELFLRGILSTD